MLCAIVGGNWNNTTNAVVRAGDSVVVNSLLGHAKDTNSLPGMVRHAACTGLSLPNGFIGKAHYVV